MKNRRCAGDASQARAALTAGGPRCLLLPPAMVAAIGLGADRAHAERAAHVRRAGPGRCGHGACASLPSRGGAPRGLSVRSVCPTTQVGFDGNGNGGIVVDEPTLLKHFQVLRRDHHWLHTIEKAAGQHTLPARMDYVFRVSTATPCVPAGLGAGRCWCAVSRPRPLGAARSRSASTPWSTTRWWRTVALSSTRRRSRRRSLSLFARRPRAPLSYPRQPQTRARVVATIPRLCSLTRNAPPASPTSTGSSCSTRGCRRPRPAARRRPTCTGT